MTEAAAVIKRDLRQEWATPSNFYGAANAEFQFTLDAAATSENAKYPRFISPEEDALDFRNPWIRGEHAGGTGCLSVWVNPGFRTMMPWVQKAFTEAQKEAGAVVAVMGPLSNALWHQFCEQHAYEIRGLYPRVQFEPAKGIVRSCNAKDNVLVIFRPTPHGWPGARTWIWDWKESEAIEKENQKGRP